MSPADESRWVPDSPTAEGTHPSPNRDERRGGRAPDMLILHYTGMATAEAALARLCEPASKVSSHYFVHEDGRILQLVPERCRAWHAGAGRWGRDDDINACSLGIEIAHPGHAGGLPPFPAIQIEATIRLSRDLVGRHAIPPERVLAHSDIAPARKEDPGERFPWDRLFAAGIGHWVEPVAAGLAEEPGSLRPGSAGPEVEALRRSLAAYGYGLSLGGDYDRETETVVTAFQRHFRPERVDGIADRSTRETLAALLDAFRA